MKCRVCGCTDEDCAGCIARTGEPCRWVATELCSACVVVWREKTAGSGHPSLKFFENQYGDRVVPHFEAPWWCASWRDDDQRPIRTMKTRVLRKWRRASDAQAFIATLRTWGGRPNL